MSNESKSSMAENQFAQSELVAKCRALVQETQKDLNEAVAEMKAFADATHDDIRKISSFIADFAFGVFTDGHELHAEQSTNGKNLASKSKTESDEDVEEAE